MKRVREDNTVGIIQRAVKHYGLHVTKSTVKEALKSHPDYPTFKSICDTLNEWKIENYPLRYEVNELEDLKSPYIVHFDRGGGIIGFVTDTGKDQVTYYTSYNEKRKTGRKEFIESCSGAVILLNPDEQSGEKEYPAKIRNELINKSILPPALTAALILIIYLFYNHLVPGESIYNKVILPLVFTKIAGIVLSVLLILHEFEVHLSITDKLCHLNKATNCNTVLHDKASKLFGWFDLAGGTYIWPQTTKDGNTLITWIDALKLKTHVASGPFKNSTPKYPEKKKELEKLANSLKETDNPILIIVSLKE